MEKLKAELWDKVQYIFRNYYDRMIHAAIEYEGNIDLDILRKSIYRVVTHFPILRSTFHSNAINPHWEVHEDYTAEEMASKVICDDIHKSVLSSLSKEISYKAKLQFDIVAHYSGERSAISVLVNHMCLDGADFKYFICKISKATIWWQKAEI